MSIRGPRLGADDSNFGFLAKHEPLFFQLGSAAEQLFAFDPNASLLKLRQLGEAMAQSIANRRPSRSMSTRRKAICSMRSITKSLSIRRFTKFRAADRRLTRVAMDRIPIELPPLIDEVEIVRQFDSLVRAARTFGPPLANTSSSVVYRPRSTGLWFAFFKCASSSQRD